MKTNGTRITALLLSALLLSACQSGQITDTENLTETTETKETVTEETSTLDLLPTEDFGGYTFKILVYENMDEEHLAENTNAEPLNDAVYYRNEYVENRFNIYIAVTVQDHATYSATVPKTAMAGEDAYDLYQIFLSYAASNCIAAGYFMDWNEISYVSENLGQPWWSQFGVEKLRINGKNFLLNGDLCHLTLGNTTGLFFNKTLFRSNDIEFPYQSVLDGTWTLDQLLTICSDQNKDLNGDGNIDPDHDQYGFMTTKYVAPIGMAIGCDLNTLLYDDDGMPKLNLNTERAVDAYEKMYQLMVESETPLVDYDANVVNSIPYKLFAEDRALVVASCMIIAELLRDMDSDFGIIPYPKLDAEQESYLSSVDAGTSSAAVMVTAADVSRTGLIVEALCEKGSELVIPAYYDIVLQGKSVRDNESQQMLDIIRQTACFDPLYVYNFSNMGFFFMDCLTSKRAEFVSLYQKREKATIKRIEKFWESIDF